MALVDEIKRRMSALGLNPKRLSLAAGLNETYVRDILGGRTNSPRWDNLGKLSAALGCTIAELTGASDPHQERETTNPYLLRKAYDLAARVLADESEENKAYGMDPIAAAIYDVLLERARSNVVTDEVEAFALIEAVIRRMRRV